MVRATHPQPGGPGLVTGGGGVTGLRVAVGKAAVGLAGHALWRVLGQQPGCGVEEGSWGPPCCRPRDPAARACWEDRSDRCLSFHHPALSQPRKVLGDRLTFDLWRRAWVRGRVGRGIRKLPLPGGWKHCFLFGSVLSHFSHRKVAALRVQHHRAGEES